jgi:hypothetical protein
MDMDTIVVFSGPVAEADMVKLYLEGHGLRVWLDDESLGTWAPHYAAGGGALAVKVRVNSADVTRANELVKQMNEENQGESRPPWTCPDCGEEIEGQFVQCWNCDKIRDADESGPNA